MGMLLRRHAEARAAKAAAEIEAVRVENEMAAAAERDAAEAKAAAEIEAVPAVADAAPPVPVAPEPPRHDHGKRRR